MRSEKLIFLFVGMLVLVAPSFAQPKRPKLRPSSDYWDRGARNVPVQFSRLSRNRKLAMVGDTLYMLNARGRVLWTWTSGGAPLTDLPVIDSQGTIYAIGGDLIWVALDSATGEEKWRGTANGRAGYSQIELHRGDIYLVVTSMEGYRVTLSDRNINDKLTLCRGNAILWQTEIPAGAKIQVRVGRVYTLIGRGRRAIRQEVAIPTHLGKPIGKVSALAGYD